ncbi:MULTISPECIES: SDR family NAD(P)-dependent oxidoreductase [Actinomadura]|uniref:SDR family NAD(P)-dependent oxidoreductase n=1 Tax=Actinomadura TaxID=1988 RepID=UPI0003F5D185|nr:MULTISPECIES: SDR family NAD(P)-dependent oxidoreductase [Actinomadura]RSN69276.1 SDR family oxidoreductase [Actinomadura sp. WAC 06369]
MRELGGRVAVVTGAASGIGRALAVRLASEGMHLALADVDPEGLGETAALARAAHRPAGGEGAGPPVVFTETVDVGDEAAVRRFADRVFAETGEVHLLCNNAGVYMGGRMWTRPAADFEWTLRVNLWGVLHGVRAFVPRMLEQGGEGHVVNTCSVAGLFAGPGAAPYTVSKWAAFAASLSLAQELAMEGSRIGVSALCPGGVATRIHESERARPAGLESAPGDDVAFMDEMIAATVAGGIAPEDVAARVVGAVRERRFLVLTHPEYEPGLADQAAALAAGRLPPLPDAEWK